MALQAPSYSNRQAWHWMVITDENIRPVIGDYYRSSSLVVPELVGLSGGPVRRRSGAQHGAATSSGERAYLGEHMGEVPVSSFPASVRHT